MEKFSPEERENLKSATIEQGELAKGGSSFDEEGNFIVAQNQIEWIQSEHKRVEEEEKALQETLSYGLSSELEESVRSGSIIYDGKNCGVFFPVRSIPQEQVIEFITKIPDIKDCRITYPRVFTEQVLMALLEKFPNVRFSINKEANTREEIEMLERLYNVETKLGIEADIIGGLRLAYPEIFKPKILEKLKRLFSK